MIANYFFPPNDIQAISKDSLLSLDRIDANQDRQNFSVTQWGTAYKIDLINGTIKARDSDVRKLKSGSFVVAQFAESSIQVRFTGKPFADAYGATLRQIPKATLLQESNCQTVIGRSDLYGRTVL